jgi:hypothetical protein
MCKDRTGTITQRPKYLYVKCFGQYEIIQLVLLTGNQAPLIPDALSRSTKCRMLRQKEK